MKKKWFVSIGALILMALVAIPALSVYYDGRFTNLLLLGGMDVKDQSSALGTPGTASQRVYGLSGILYSKNSSGTASVLGGTKKYIQLPLNTFMVESGGDGSSVGTTPAPLSTSTAPGLEIDDNMVSLVWADGETTPVQVTFRVPADYVSSGRFKLFATESGTSTANQVDFDVYVNSDGVASDAAATGQTPVALAGTSSTPDEITLTPATDFASLSSGKWVTLRLWRDDVATGTNDLEVKGVVFEYD
jgi:hypothetical protein